jgi:hypothetical protein
MSVMNCHYNNAKDDVIIICKININSKNAVFWNVTSCGSCMNRRFGRKYRLFHHGEENRRDRKYGGSN